MYLYILSVTNPSTILYDDAIISLCYVKLINNQKI